MAESEHLREWRAVIDDTTARSTECPSCGAGVTLWCKTRTGNPTRPHIGRLYSAYVARLRYSTGEEA